MNMGDLFSTVLAFLWQAILSYAQTPQGEAELARILADLEGQTPTAAPPPPSPGPAWLEEKPAKKAKPETEAQRRVRMGL